jgi:Zn-dependent protease
MKWSFNIGRFAGIDVKMHFTFLLLLAWVAFAHWQRTQSLSAVMAGVAFILAIFLCVALHEYGHALMARQYSIKTRDITLLPIGGVARLEQIPTQPVQELWVALAGPAVNVVIAVGLFAWLMISSTLEPLSGLTVTAGPFLERIMVVNIFLVLFNLIPAFPMDGGRILRALLSMKMNHARATQIAASIGQGLAVVFGLIGLLYNPFLLFIAFFVWIGAAQEAVVSQLKSAVDGIPVEQAMITDFRTLDRNDTLQAAMQLTLSGAQKDFPVIRSDGHVEGILTQTKLLEALTSNGQSASVNSVAENRFITVDSRDMLDTAFSKLNDCECHTLPVVRDGKLVGLVTMDNLGEFVRIQSALRN